MLRRQTLQPDKVYLINYTPRQQSPDLTQRIRIGWERAKNDNIDFCFIIENDDYYPANYLAKMSPGWSANRLVDFVGIDTTIYYHVYFQRILRMQHDGRSSLFCTGFRTNALDNFKWPDDKYLFLDILLWKFAQKKKFASGIIPIGIKHGFGLCGGMGHSNGHNFPEDGSKWILQNVDPDMLPFYLKFKKDARGTH
jgi:hypothetical protein